MRAAIKCLNSVIGRKSFTTIKCSKVTAVKVYN